ncbi:MAG: S8 family serine peptidase, partial [Thermoprotei archaeon]
MSKTLTLFLLLVLLVSIASPLTLIVYGSSTSMLNALDETWKLKVDPLLLEDKYYGFGLLEKLGIPTPSLGTQIPVNIVSIIRENQAKVGIIASDKADITQLAKLTKGVIFAHRVNSAWYIEAWVTKNDVELLAKNPYVYRIFSITSPLASILAERTLLSRTETGAGAEPTLYAAVDVIGASKVWEEFNITGKGVKVAVVDTGVDFGITDLGAEAIARTEDGIPLIFDSDEIGLVLTLTTVIKNASGYINIVEPVMFFDWFGLLFGYPVIGNTNYGWVSVSSPRGYELRVFPLTSFYVGDIHSKDNVFKFGIAVQTVWPNYGESIIQYTVPVIVADSDDDGAYDTVYADLSTVYYYLIDALYTLGLTTITPDPAWLDFSFIDEPAAYYGSEVLARDFTGDGINDFSIGALAGYVYDWLGVFTASELGGWDIAWETYAEILPGFDPNGNYISIAYDWLGHGTSCAGVIASRGRVEYDLGYGVFRLRGIAPEAQIASAPGYLINAITAQFFFAGFDPVGTPWNWTYTGEHKVDVISNSWGSSYIAYLGFASGTDPMSLLENYITSVSGTVIVHAVGNGGPGYGTITMPGSGDLVISIGASTLFEYRPLYGYLPGPGGEVVSWSDRGPTDLGTVKPDVVNIGSFAWAPAPWHFGYGNGLGAYDLFGGTSEATPMTSGSVALIIAAYKSKYNSSPTPGFVKTLLKSAARDLGYDPFVQGAGHVDVYTAVKTIFEGGLPRVYSYTVYENIKELLSDEELGYPLQPVEDTQLYTGPVLPGTESTYTLYIEGTGTYSLEAYTFKISREGLVPYLDLENAIAYTPDGPMPLKDLVVDIKDDMIVLNLTYPAISHILIPVNENAYIDEDFVQFVASYPYEVYDPEGRNGIYRSPLYSGPWLYLGSEIHYWFDLDNDNTVEMNETARINYDIRYANNLHVTMGKPREKVEAIIERVSEYLGESLENVNKALVFDIRVLLNTYYYVSGPVVVPLRLELVKASREPWNWIRVPESSSGGSVEVSIAVPEDAKPGVYEGYIVVKGGAKEVLVPVSVIVKAKLTESDKYLVLEGTMENTLYENYYIEGQFDWSWRYESGDWRTFPLEVTDDSVIGLIVTVEWKENDTNIDVAVAGTGSPYFLAGEPDKEYYGSIIAAKLSLYLYRSGWITHYDRPAPGRATIFVPVEYTGLYWIIVRNTLIGAKEYYPESFRVVIVPIRISEREPVIEVVNKEGEGTLTIYGSYALSYADLTVIPVEGDALIEVPEELGFGNYHVIPVKVYATTDSKAYLGIILEGYTQYTLGLTIAGIRIHYDYPAIIWIPVTIT